MEIIATITIPKYIRKVKMSNKQRPVYFEWSGVTIKSKKAKVPRAFFRDKNNYPENILIEDLKEGYCITIINDKGKIVDYIKENKRLPNKPIFKWKYILYFFTEEGYLPVVANPKKAGTPNYYTINGQDIYNGYLKDFALGKVMGAIKQCYKPNISNLPVITEYPIKIHCDFYDTIKHEHDNSKNDYGQAWDMDNYAFPYVKAFPDLLVAQGILKNDDRLHLPGNVSADFIPIDNHEDRKLVFTISKVTRPEIIENEVYKSFHKNPNTYETEDLDLVEEDYGFKRTGFGKTELLSIEEVTERYNLSEKEVNELRRIQNLKNEDKLKETKVLSADEVANSLNEQLEKLGDLRRIINPNNKDEKI